MADYRPQPIAAPKKHEIIFSTFSNGTYVDLMPYQYGREQCEPGHAFGPARRKHYLFHYILGGKGTLVADDDLGRQHTYALGQGEGFQIFPGQVCTYVADLSDPWEYIWIEFDGLRAKGALDQVGLCAASPVYRTVSTGVSEQMESVMRAIVDARNPSPLWVVGQTYLFLDLLVSSAHTPKPAPSTRLQDMYLKRALTFIEEHYRGDISVEDIARHAGLNRSYFGKVFKAAMGKSPQQYLIGYRMDKAAELLKLTSLSVGEVGREVGYPNQLHFSRVFKSVYGAAPREWRRAQTRA